MANNVKTKTNVWLEVIPSLVSQDIASNKSKVRVRVKLHNPYGTYTYAGGGPGWRIRYVIKNGTTVLHDTGWIDFDYSIGTIYSLDKTFDVPHTADGQVGSSEFSVTLSGEPDQGLASTGGHVASTTLAIPTISRASSFTIAGDTIASPIKLTINRASNSFTHKVYYRLPGTGLVLAQSGAGSSAQFTIPINRCSAFPNTAQGQMTVKLETYNGSTLIGQKSQTVPIKVPTTILPTGSVSLHLEGPNPSNLPTTAGKFVQSKQSMRVDTTASGAFGSTIKKITVKVQGHNYTGSSVITSPLAQSGNHWAEVTIEDSRGRKVSTAKAYEVYAYKPPVIRRMVANRCNVDGTPNAQGAHARIEFSAEVPVIMPDALHSDYKLYYREKGASAWSMMYRETNSSTSSYNQVKSFSLLRGYEIKLEVTGWFETADQIINLSSANYPLTWETDGSFKIGIGMPALYPGINFPEMPKINGQPFFEGIEIQMGVNLNSYKTPGFYHCPLSATAASLSNCPVTHAFNLEILKHANDSVRQIVREYRSKEPRTYERNCYLNSWGAWVETLTTHNASDYVIEQGAGYVKWASGRMEQTATVTMSVSFQEWGAIFRTNAINAPNFVHSFVGKFAVYHSIEFATGWCGHFIIHPTSQRNAGGVALWRPVATSGAHEVTVNFKAEGRWK